MAETKLFPDQPDDITRADIVDALVQADIDCNGESWFVASLLRDGFVGYSKWTDDELAASALQSFGQVYGDVYHVVWNELRKVAERCPKG
jgi:hypothetical protein